MGGSDLGVAGVQKFLLGSSYSRCDDEIPILRNLQDSKFTKVCRM